MERRQFIKQCGLSSVFIAAVLQSCKSYVYVANTTEGSRIAVKKSDFGQNKFVLVRNERLQAPVYLLRTGEETYSAVLMLCTHKACELNPGGDRLVCPCHGSEFSGTGQVLAPPAEKDLKKYFVSTDTTTIYIQL